jgi:hypothetical protein
VFRWVRKSFILGMQKWNYFISFGNLFKKKKGGRINHLIWLATMWYIWKHRNNVVFNGTIQNASFILDDIKTYSRA